MQIIIEVFFRKQKKDMLMHIPAILIRYKNSRGKSPLDIRFKGISLFKITCLPSPAEPFFALR